VGLEGILSFAGVRLVVEVNVQTRKDASGLICWRARDDAAVNAQKDVEEMEQI
jgi:hypothetical protein